MILDLVIEGSTTVTASDTFQCDVGIASGTIVTLGSRLGPATQYIDTSGRLVLPGGIDNHVHISHPIPRSNAS